jgi:hypothetical protein
VPHIQRTLPIAILRAIECQVGSLVREIDVNFHLMTDQL